MSEFAFAVAISTDPAELGWVPADEPEVFDEVFAHVLGAALRAAVRQLPCPERQVVALRYGLMHGPPMPWTDICKLVGCSDKSARRAERRALERLRVSALAGLVS